MEIIHDNLIDALVAITSLCENNSSHIYLALHFDGCSYQEIQEFDVSLKKYPNLHIVSSQSKRPEPDEVLLPSYMVIDGNIEKVVADIISSNGSKSLFDYAVNAPSAHDSGMTFTEFKSTNYIIFYPDDKPYHCSNIHYDLEKIWWDYANKTDIADKIKQTFLENSLSDFSLETYAEKLVSENQELSETINSLQACLEHII